MTPDWLLWQLADSTFPAGGFAHSGGLEAAWQTGLLADASGLAGMLRSSLRQAARGTAPFVAVSCRDPGLFDRADELCEAFLSNHVANRASRSQGRAFLTASDRVFVRPGIRGLAAASAGASDGEARRCLHFGPVFGVVAAALGLDPASAASLFLFLSLRSLVSAAVRLGIVGPLQAQSIQATLSSEADDLVRLSISLTLEDVALTAPLLDLAQATHDRLYSRLFQS